MAPCDQLVYDGSRFFCIFGGDRNSVHDNIIISKKGRIALMLVVLEKKTQVTFHKPLDS